VIPEYIEEYNKQAFLCEYCHRCVSISAWENPTKKDIYLAIMDNGGRRDWQFAYNTDYWGIEMAAVFDQKELKRQKRIETQNGCRHEKRRRGEERARVARFKERERWVNPAHIDRIVEQARQAAADGIQGAFEAVDQALRNMQLSVPPSPHPPHPPHPPVPPIYPDAPNYEYQGDDAGSEEARVEVRVEPLEASKASVDIEQERKAILHMIAEGRLSPDEGDMLLEALG